MSGLQDALQKLRREKTRDSSENGTEFKHQQRNCNEEIVKNIKAADERTLWENLFSLEDVEEETGALEIMQINISPKVDSGPSRVGETRGERNELASRQINATKRARPSGPVDEALLEHEMYTGYEECYDPPGPLSTMASAPSSAHALPHPTPLVHVKGAPGKLMPHSRGETSCITDLSNIDFSSGVWKKMEKDRVKGYSVAQVLKRASSRKLPEGKVPLLSALIASVDFSERNAIIQLMDPSGTVAGALHYRLVEKYSEQLNVGNGVVLRNVSVLTPKPHHHYLNIIQTNFAAVYSKSCEGSILCLAIEDAQKSAKEQVLSVTRELNIVKEGETLKKPRYFNCSDGFNQESEVVFDAFLNEDELNVFEEF